jgi:hypothetical protein
MYNCPITDGDIRAAEHIIGPTVLVLKGKIVTKASVPVSGKIESVPQSIMEHYQKAIMYMDILCSSTSFHSWLPSLVVYILE